MPHGTRNLTDKNLKSVYFTDLEHGWIVGEDGIILYYGNTPLGINIINKTQNNIITNCYPNPFSYQTTIKYNLEKYENVNIVIYNSEGEIIKTLINKNQEPGEYSINFANINLPAGIYFYQLSVVKNTITRKIIKAR